MSARFTILLCLTASGVTMAQDVVRAPRPAAPYVVSACPFECCVYGRWKFLTAANVRSGAQPSAPVIGRIETGQRVRATHGHVRVDSLGLVLVRRDFRDANMGNNYRAGDTLLVLDYIGEGFSHAWVGGQRRRLDLGFVLSEHGPPVGRDTSAMLELQPPARQWWAHIELPIAVAKDRSVRPAVRTGWVHMTSDVEVRGADACGVDSL
jgi:hypothetical protein